METWRDHTDEQQKEPEMKVTTMLLGVASAICACAARVLIGKTCHYDCALYNYIFCVFICCLAGCCLYI